MSRWHDPSPFSPSRGGRDRSTVTSMCTAPTGSSSIRGRRCSSRGGEDTGPRLYGGAGAPLPLRDTRADPPYETHPAVSLLAHSASTRRRVQPPACADRGTPAAASAVAGLARRQTARAAPRYRGGAQGSGARGSSAVTTSTTTGPLAAIAS